MHRTCCTTPTTKYAKLLSRGSIPISRHVTQRTPTCGQILPIRGERHRRKHFPTVLVTANNAYLFSFAHVKKRNHARVYMTDSRSLGRPAHGRQALAIGR